MNVLRLDVFNFWNVGRWGVGYVMEVMLAVVS